jgi:hypothetical protein
MMEKAPATAAPSRQDFEREVITRAGTDPAFRAELLADPRAAVKKTYGVDLPPSIELRVVEETPSVFYLVLPLKSAELTDEQLAAVAGGSGLANIFPKVEVGRIFDKDGLAGIKWDSGGGSIAAALPGIHKYE